MTVGASRDGSQMANTASIQSAQIGMNILSLWKSVAVNKQYETLLKVSKCARAKSVSEHSRNNA